MVFEGQGRQRGAYVGEFLGDGATGIRQPDLDALSLVDGEHVVVLADAVGDHRTGFQSVLQGLLLQDAALAGGQQMMYFHDGVLVVDMPHGIGRRAAVNVEH